MYGLSFLKKIALVKRQTTSVAICGDTGKYIFLIKQQILELKYWISLIYMPKNSCTTRWRL